MVKALLLVARWIGLANDRWRDAARRRPISVEMDLLHDLVARLRSENELLRTRLGHLDPAHRPRYRPWERLRILWHQARYGLSLRATARAFLLSTQTLVNWHKDAASLATIQRRLTSYVVWFNASRPHQGLGQRTPDESHFGRATAATSVPVRAALEVRLHEGQHDLPVFRLRHAA